MQIRGVLASRPSREQLLLQFFVPAPKRIGLLRLSFHSSVQLFLLSAFNLLHVLSVLLIFELLYDVGGRVGGEFVERKGGGVLLVEGFLLFRIKNHGFQFLFQGRKFRAFLLIHFA